MIVESHMTYNKELKLNDEVEINLVYFDHDKKRLQYKIEMVHKEKKFLASTIEVLALHVDLNNRKVIEFDKEKNLLMDGAKVYDFVNSEQIKLLKSIISKNRKIKVLFNHQASLTVENLIKEKLKNYKIIIPSNIKKIGNTCSASIPHLLNEYFKKNKFKKNDKILVCGFGVGLTVTASILKII